MPNIIIPDGLTGDVTLIAKVDEKTADQTGNVKIRAFKTYTGVFYLPNDAANYPMTIAELLQNDFEQDLVWTHPSVGVWRGTIVGAFPSSLRIIITNYGDGDNGTLVKFGGVFINVWRNDNDSIDVRFFSDEDGAIPTDMLPQGLDFVLEFKVYEAAS